MVVGGVLVRDQSNLDDVIESLGPGIRASTPDAEWGTDLYAGIAFNTYVTARLGYRTFGDAKTKVKMTDVKAEMEADGFYLALDLMAPLSEQFKVGATLGIQKVDVTVKVKDAWGSVKDDDDARDFFYGLRAEYQMSGQLAVTANYNRYKFDIDASGVDDLKYNSLGIGVQYRF